MHMPPYIHCLCICIFRVGWPARNLTLPLAPCPLPLSQEYLLPDGVSRKVVKSTLLNLLTCPPPYAVAAEVRRAVGMLSECDRPLVAVVSVAMWGGGAGMYAWSEGVRHHT